MASKSDKREKRRKAREANKLNRSVPEKKLQQGKQLIAFLATFVLIAAGLVLYLQH